MAIEININDKNASDFMSRFFAEYCMSIRGPLFQDPDQYLSDNTFDTLKKKIIQFCEPPRSYQECRNSRTAYDWKSFYRCFGIFLREAVLRYAKSLSQGEFWEDINIFVDISLFNRCTLEEIIKLEDRNGDTLFYNTFREFHVEDIRYPRAEQNDYIGHLLKIAVLPFNLNPFDYRVCRQEYLRNNLGNFIYNATQVSLNRHPATKELLTRKINDFFVYYEDLKNFPLDIQIDRLENFYGISRRNKWIYNWLDQASSNHTAPISQTQDQNSLQKIQQRIRNNSIKQSRILLRLFGEQEIRYQTTQSIDALGVLFKEVFNDKNCKHRLSDEMTLSLDDGKSITIRNKHFLNISNEAVDHLMVSKGLSVTINGVEYNNLDNPWYTGRNWHILNYTGSELSRLAADANHHCYIVIPADKSISYFYTDFANKNKNIPTPLRGITSFKVYKIDSRVLQNAETLHFVLNNGGEFHIEVEDPTYLRLHQITEHNTVVGPTKFIFQQKAHKIGVGNIEFSIKTLENIEGADYDKIVNLLKSAYVDEKQLSNNDISVQIQENSLNGVEYLCIVNKTNNILELEEKSIPNTQLKLPSITLFPGSIEIWVAKKSTDPSDYFCPFISGKVENLNGNWSNWQNENNCRIYDGGNEWFNSGANVSFANRAIFLHAPYLTTRARGVNNWDDSRSIPMYNEVFGSLIPEKAQYFFKWLENDSVCKAEVMRITTHATYGKTIRDAYRDLDINGAGVLFGWEYMHSYFVNQYQQAIDYTGPRTPRTEGFYTWSEEDRHDILCNTLSNGLYLEIEFNQYAELFQQEPTLEKSCRECKTTAEMRAIINTYLEKELRSLVNQYAELFQQEPTLENSCRECRTTAEMRALINDCLERHNPNYNSIRIQRAIDQVYATIRECIHEGIIPQNVMDGDPISRNFPTTYPDEIVRERLLYRICKRYYRRKHNCDWIEDPEHMDAIYVDVFDLKPDEDLATRKHEVFAQPLTREFLQTVFDNI